MTQSIQLGELQLAIMKILWDRNEASVVDVHRALSARGLAPTTIATMLKKMEDRGLVTHRSEGRKFLYRPLVSEAEVTESMVDHLTTRLFDGDPMALVSHLISSQAVNNEELDALESLIAQAKKEQEQ